MTQFIFFIIGLILGGFTATTFLAVLQLNRIQKYECEIYRLREQLENK